MTNTTELPTPREVIIEAMAMEVEAAHEKHVIAYSINRVKTYGWKLPAGSTGQESEPKSMDACIEASDAFDEVLRKQLQDAFELGQAAGQATAPQCLHQIQEPAPVLAAQPEGDYLEGVNIPNLREALIFLGRENGVGEGEVGTKLAQYVNSIVSGVLSRKATLRATPQTAPAAVAVPDERAAFEAWWTVSPEINEFLFQNGIDDSGQQQSLFFAAAYIAWKARAALATTPAADAPEMVSVKKEDAENYCRILAALGMEEEGDPVAEVKLLREMDKDFAQTIEERDTAEGWADGLAGLIGKHFGKDIGEHSSAHCPWQAAKEIIEDAEPPTAAAPVVLPEPVGAIAWNRDGTRPTFHAGCRDKELLQASLDEGLTGGPYRTEFVYTEQHLHAVLATATGLPAQAVASIYVTEDGQRECDDWKVPLPVGRNLLYAAPQAQADANDSALLDFIESHAEGVIRLDAVPNYLYWGKHWEHKTARAAIAAAKGEHQ